MITGKALLVIQRHATGFDIDSYVQSCSSSDWTARESVKDALWCAGWGPLPLPVAADRLSVGEAVRVAVTYWLTCTEDYWGERDYDFGYTKVRVLRRQSPRERY